ncbi:hypothetical protein [Paenibacillus massiliensis]|uniref:hypothetical protein n=1 Tax=Paenibacillus massiliensis TaxID=225917 RepID=UPI00048D0663|nr:hypothetical protein [Paenibacillus massiliensis]
MNKRIVSTILSTALICAAAPIFASNNSSSVSNTTNQASIVKEVPKMKIVNGLYDPGEIVLHSVLLNTTYNFSSGQGTGNFQFKAGSSREKVRVHVSNNKKVDVNYRLVSPRGNNWVDMPVRAGKSLTTEHWFDSQQAGTWILKFDTNDGSAVAVSVSVWDGLE